MDDNIKGKRPRSSISLIIDDKRPIHLNDQFRNKDFVSQIGDKFLLSEARCDDLQAKLDLIKSLKKKRRRSMTKITNSSIPEEGAPLPLITIRAQPKKVTEVTSRKTRPVQYQMHNSKSYLDPATLEQHQMIREYNQYRNMQEEVQPKINAYRQRPKIARHYRNIDADAQYLGKIKHQGGSFILEKHEEPAMDNYLVNRKITSTKVPKNAKKSKKLSNSASGNSLVKHRPVKGERIQSHIGKFSSYNTETIEKGQVIEHHEKDVPYNDDRALGKQIRHTSWHAVNIGKGNFYKETENFSDDVIKTSPDVRPEHNKKGFRSSQRKNSQVRRYNLPTIASQIKHSDVCYLTNSLRYTNIPFVTSKSTTPSHNLGVNIQQVLSGIKLQQPVSRIPYTIAHHMGLRQMPEQRSPKTSMSAQMCMDEKYWNVLNFGQKQLILPLKCMTFNRLLKLYRENGGIVSRFLRSVSNPNYFYPSLDNSPEGEEYDDGAQYSEYANLCREYENTEERIMKHGSTEKLEKHKQKIIEELTARESRMTS